MYIVTNLHLWIYGPRPKSALVPQALAGSILIGQFTFPVYRIAVIFAGGLLCLVLWYLQEKTKVGAIIRAGMDDPQMARGLGINLTPVNVGAFCLGAGLAGFAGFAGAPVLGGANLATGTEMFFTAIAVCIVGGVGSVQGALAGALLIGVATIFVGAYLPDMATYVTYMLMVIVLLFRPAGLLGAK
jgi:branched-chain amino acid transport system permease protein